ncbi:ribonuclease P protein component [Allopusillimonas soli]|uniref:Ribonuclease P protein component n=1 Tax=Allopusillimonas soli TaxID=659016 RepID=A0A853FDR7_9BURK|nr:ribonuclease P protein component [Allopusillimonas soli]NYT37792.1 ribonuclease P protein component [Allopusillimonas soli]TEA74063.1 ribonuclease P protein component [Allopusillimonas soli]
MMRASFPATARLHCPSEYASALKGRRLARGALFVVMTPRDTGTEGMNASSPRLGMIIAKRFAPHAVTRNAIKRVLREAFRHKRHMLPGRDLVFRLHVRVEPSSLCELKRRVRAEADALLARAAQ